MSDDSYGCLKHCYSDCDGSCGEEHLYKLCALIDEKDYKKCARICKAVLKKYTDQECERVVAPLYAKALYERVMANHGDLYACEVQHLLAIKFDPNNADLHYRFARLCHLHFQMYHLQYLNT